MARTHNRFIRTYVSGYDLSGQARSIGSVGYKFDSTPDAALTDGCKNIVNGQAEIQVDPLNAFLSPETSPAIGIHELLSSGSGLQTYTIAYGVLAAPAQGDIIFSMPMEQAQYKTEGVAVNIGWGGPTSTNSLISSGFASPFGRLLHAKGAETGANTAVGIDDYGATPPSLGGIFTYHLFSSDGTVTLTAQEADTNSNGSFANITGATSGSITAAVAPKHGMVATSTTYAVKRYLRWQLAFGTASTATFLIGFSRRLWI
jgi:hypothetical protein